MHPTKGIDKIKNFHSRNGKFNYSKLNKRLKGEDKNKKFTARND